MLTELLNKIDSYLRGDTDLLGLEDWVVGHLQDVLDSGDETAIDIANRIDADLIEFGEGLLDTPSLNNRLQRYLYNAQTIEYEYGRSVSADVKTEAGATPVVDVPCRQPIVV